MGEIDFIIDGAVKNKLDSADEVIEPATDKPAITKPGDLWLLGDHRLYCGDNMKQKPLMLEHCFLNVSRHNQPKHSHLAPKKITRTR